MSEIKHQTCEIRLKGQIDESWSECFGGFVFTHESDGTTTLTGRIIDQSALHGLLKRIRDLGLTLISVNCLTADEKNNI